MNQVQAEVFTPDQMEILSMQVEVATTTEGDCLQLPTDQEEELD